MTYSGGIPSGSKNANDPLATGSFSSDPGQAVFPANVFPPATSSSDYSLYSSTGPTIVSNIFAHYNMTKTVDQLPFGMGGGVNIIRERASGSAYAQFQNNKEQNFIISSSESGGATGIPQTISGLQLWLDATDITNGGTQPSDGAAVSVWSDKSGNNNHFTQSYSIYQPFVSSSHGVANNKDVVFFSMPSINSHVDENGGVTTTGSADRMGSALSASYPITLVTVFASAENPSSLSSGKHRSFVQGSRHSNTPSATHNNGWFVGNSDGKMRFRSGAGNTLGSNHTVLQDKFYVTIATIAADKSSTFYINGNVSGSNPGSNADSAVGPGLIALGAHYRDSMTGGFVDTWDYGTSGSLAEVIIYNNVISDVDRATLNDYLFTKWGVLSGAA